MAVRDRLAHVPLVGTALVVAARYKDDAGNQLAAAIAFFAFLALFPLLLVGLSVVGFVLAGDPGAQRDIITAVTRAIPGFDGALGQSEIGSAIGSLVDNRGGVGAIGLVLLLFSGLRVIDAASVATGRVFRVAAGANAVRTRVRELGVLALLGILFVAGAALTSLTNAAGPLAAVVAPLASVGVDTALFLAAYRYLNHDGPDVGRLWPGALIAATGWVALKAFGATYVSEKVAEANALYGTLGGVFALLFLLFLGARLYLYGAELNAVLADATGHGTDGAATAEASGLTSASAAPPSSEERELVSDERWPRDDAADAGPLPPALPADRSSDTVSERTRERLAEADEEVIRLRDPHPVQRAIAFALGLGIVAALIRAIGLPGSDDDRHR